MSPMNLQRFSELLDAYGGDPQRWPAAEREPAQALLATSPRAVELQGRAARLDAELDAFSTSPPAPALRQALLAAMPARRRRWPVALADFWHELGGWRLAGPAFAASLVLGALAPVWLEDSPADLPDEDLITAMQLVDALPEWNP